MILSVSVNRASAPEPVEMFSNLAIALVFQAKSSTKAVYTGVGTHEKGFVRLRNNLTLNGAVLEEYQPSMVPDPPYSRRTVHLADRRLIQALKDNTGWQQVHIF